MPNAYLSPDEYATYGLDGDTTAADVINASAVVNSHTMRVEGLVWMPDSRGLPCYMAGLTPTASYTLPVALTGGVAATFAFPAAGAGASNLLNEILIVDRANTGAVEALVITGVDTAHATITVAPPVNNHAIGATLELGMTIVEERAIAPKRSQTRVTRWPVARLLSGCGRYSYGRRSDQVAGLYNDVNLIAAVQTFGGPPQWIPFDIRQADISIATGEVWVPAGLLLAYYTDVRLRYVAGYPASGVPQAVKQATANIVRNAKNAEFAPPNFKVFQAGGTKVERWSSSDLDEDTKRLLDPFCQKLMF